MASVAALTSRAVTSSAAAKSPAPVQEPVRRDDVAEFEEERALEVEREDARAVGWSLAGMRMGPPPPGDEGGGGQENRRDGFSKGRIPVSTAIARFRAAQEKSLWRGHTRSATRFRVPTGADLTKLWDSHQIPEDVFKERLATALTRMYNEFAFRSDEPISEVMKRLFPKPGVFDQAEFEKKVNQSLRFDVYQSVADAEAKIKPAEKPKFIDAIDKSVELIKKVEADDKNLTKVFGTKKARAKTNYGNARKSLGNLKKNLDANVTTDYNLDDKEVGLGGWATADDQHAHFMPEVVRVEKIEAAESTIIHEAAHLSNPDVLDKGYYGSPGFENRPEEAKVTNAAHYEEVPRRILKTSIYTDKDHAGEFIEFKPGATSSGGKLTFEDKAKSQASEMGRKAWDAAVDAHTLIRNVRKKQLDGNSSEFTKKKARLLELSKLMRLTIHEQDPKSASVNQIDVVLAEGVAHAMSKVESRLKHPEVPPELRITFPPLPTLQPLPFELPKKSTSLLDTQLKLDPALDPSKQVRFTNRTVDEAAMEAVEKVVKDLGLITQSLEDDLKLVRWLVDHVGNVL